MKISGIFLFSIILLLTGCKNATQSENQESETKSQKDINDQLTQVLQRPAQLQDIVMYTLLSGVEYEPELCLDPAKAAVYADHPIAAASALGVYAADILYHYSYLNIDNSNLSFQAARSLAESIDLTNFYSETHSARFSNQKLPADSLIMLMEKSLTNSSLNLNKDEQLILGYALLAGNLIEKTYFSLHLFSKFDLNNENIEQQALAAKNIKQVLSLHQIQMNELHDIAVSLPTEGGKVFIDQLERANKLFQSIDFASFDLSDLETFFGNATIKKLYGEVQKTRQIIVDVSWKE